MNSRLMGLDVGDRSIGVALTDPERRIASPATTIRRTDLASDLAAIKTLVREKEVGEIVVGMPKSLSGELHFQAEKTLLFIEHLQGAVDVPIRMWDERFTTAEANRALLAGQVRRARRKEVIDQTAASLILQGYLAANDRE